jgi:hypothetical protein
VSEPGIDQLLIASALDADLLRRLRESPEEAFQGFDLTDEEKDLLRHPDHRLLPLLGAALAHQRTSPAPAPPAAQAAVSEPHAVVDRGKLPDVSLVLTLVPCAQYEEDGRLVSIRYAVWVNPLPAGADPASLPPPPGATFPGQPLTPLHAVIQVSPLQIEGSIGLSAIFRQSTNIAAPRLPGSAGKPDGKDLGSEQIQTAVAAVRNAPAGERYEKLVDLIHVLREGKGR